MKLDELKKLLDSLIGCITFDYMGKSCGIDPINHSHYEMWFDDKAYIARSIDEVISQKLFAGKSLDEICTDIVNVDY